MVKKQAKVKIGRNDPCPCGSGLKFKRCHGLSVQLPIRPIPEDWRQALYEHQAREFLRQHQQGLGKPIISTEHNGYRFTAVGNQLHYSKSHNTFIDFLGDYIRSVLTPEWGNSEISKPLHERHIILQWYDAICAIQKKTMGDEPSGVHTIQANGVISAYYGLAYNLYLLQHNVELQKYLVGRLKREESFHAAYYETHVAAWFILAGFSLCLENEQDYSRTHPEFIASRDGLSYSIEAKARQAGKKHVDVGNQLYKALSIESRCPRVVFIDLNIPPFLDSKQIADEVSTNIRGREEKLQIKGSIAPEAYIFVTNRPHHLALDDTNIPIFCLTVGFKIPDFGYGAKYKSYTEAYLARLKYRQLYDVQKAMGNYKIPVTFNGELPEFAFGEAERRFTIGQRISLSKEIFGVIQSGIVVVPEKKAYLVVCTEDGIDHIFIVDLSDFEIAAYKAHPQTFFGRIEAVQTTIDDPLDMYEFFINGYKETTRDRLLQFMEKSPDFDRLQILSKEELLYEYAERLTRTQFRGSSITRPN